MAVDKSGRRVREMFGAIAPHYDRLNHLLSMNVDRYWRRRTVKLCRADGPQPILDVCTGTGDLAFAFSRYVAGRTTVIGADFCHPMLVRGCGKRRPPAAPHAAIPRAAEPVFVEADAQQLPFADGQFQIVSVAFGLRNVADTDLGLREMARVCSSGGRVAVLEFSTPRRQPFKAAYGWYFRHILPRVGQWLARNSHEAYEYLPQSVGEFPQGEALAERMRRAGLNSVVCHPLSMGIATLYLGVK